MKPQTLPLASESPVMVPAGATPRLGALLVQAGCLSASDAERIHGHQMASGQLFGEAGIELGLLQADDVRQALCAQYGHVCLKADCGLSGELMAVWQPQARPVEHLRGLRSQLMLRWFENDARHAALTLVSPGRGEGRSYITANLAALFAQLGKRTLVIDADMRHPRQHRLFGVGGRTGLAGVLAGRVGTEAIVGIDAIPGLSVLPSGVPPPNPQELIARSGLPRLLSALRSSFEVILVDTPAFSECADGATVAARAGAALLVTCRDSTSMPGLTALSQSLHEFGVTVVGAVFNAPDRA